MRKLQSNFRDNFTEILYKDSHNNKINEYSKILNSAVNAFNRLDFMSVVEGTREAHLAFLTDQQIESRLVELKPYGLTIVKLNKEAAPDSSTYGNHAKSYDGSGSYHWRCILTKNENVKKWNDIWQLRSQDVSFAEYLIGRGLGYPECCSRFFTRVWIQDGGIDTTWQQAICTVNPFTNQGEYSCLLPHYEQTTVELPDTTPIWASNLLRWVGLKLVTHLPCSFNCVESKRIALENLGLATKHGFGYEYNKLCQMLDWDITWTAQLGVATIETPVFIINTVTDITAEKYVVHKKGHNNCIL